MVNRILGVCKLSTKGQVTIPSEARKLFNLNIGDLILFTEEEGKLVIKKA